MSDPQRYLKDENSPPLARALLGSASEDGLDEAQMAALARALRVESVAIGAGPAHKSIFSRIPLAPALAAITTVAMAVTVGVVSGSFEDGDGRALPTTATPATPAATMNKEPPVVAPVDTSSREAVSVDLLPEAPPASAPVRAGAGTNARAMTPSSSASSNLANEVRALERIRIAIAERRIDNARAGLADYERAFPKKLLGDEARVLELEMLLAEGRREEAEKLAAAFLAASKDSPYSARVRSLIAPPRLP